MEGDIWGISGRLIIRSGVHLVLAMQTHEYHLTGPSTSLYNQYENTAVLTGGCPKGWTVLLKGYVILKRKLVRVSEKPSLPLNCSCLPLLNTAWCITSAFHYWGQERAAGFVKLQDSKFLGCCNHILGCFQLSSHIRENRRIRVVHPEAAMASTSKALFTLGKAVTWEQPKGMQTPRATSKALPATRNH